ncbi:MAG: hypothetical protein ACODAE_10460 [Gemmatimonadota bacterium]
MADINVERKGPSIWPWVIGLLVLALLIWAIAEMVDTDEEVAVEEPVEEVTEAPAAVPEPEAVEPDIEEPDFAIEEATELETLMPLGSEDVGQPVLVSGEVVGVPTPDGFFVHTGTEENDVIWVQLPAWSEDGDQWMMDDIEQGQNVDIVGVVQPLQADQATQAVEDAELSADEDFQDWNVRSDYLIANSAEGIDQQPMMEDTVDGRY